MASLLPINECESSMLRASVLTIVLLLAIGQNTALVCSVWCHSGRAAAMSECHDHGHSTTPSVRGTDGCELVMVSSAPLMREDVRRVSDEGTRYAVLVPRFQVSSTASETHQVLVSECALPLHSRPLVLALRI
jgi:hypothetical protein